jgi:SAM-dependent methyltransferase
MPDPAPPRVSHVWDDPENFALYEPVRQLVRPATRMALCRLFANEQAEGPVLEIGSGHGELYDLSPPEWRKRLHQTDGVEATVAANRLRHPDATVSVANAYDLTGAGIAPSTYGLVVSYSALDVLEDLGLAAAQIARVLSPGGTLLHLMDLMPNYEVMIRSLPDELIPFPATEQGVMTGFHIMSRQTYEQARTWLDASQQVLLDLFVTRPAMALRLYGDQLDSLEKFDDMISVLPPHLERRTIRIIDLFEQRLAEALRSAGLVPEPGQLIHGQATVAPTEAHRQRNPQAIRWVSNVGIVRGFTTGRGVPKGEVQVHSFLRVMRATKP